MNKKEVAKKEVAVVKAEASASVDAEVRHVVMLTRNGKVLPDTCTWSTADTYGIEIRYVAEAHLKTFFKLEPVLGHSDPAD